MCLFCTKKILRCNMLCRKNLISTLFEFWKSFRGGGRDILTFWNTIYRIKIVPPGFFVESHTDLTLSCLPDTDLFFVESHTDLMLSCLPDTDLFYCHIRLRHTLLCLKWIFFIVASHIDLMLSRFTLTCFFVAPHIDLTLSRLTLTCVLSQHLTLT